MVSLLLNNLSCLTVLNYDVNTLNELVNLQTTDCVDTVSLSCEVRLDTVDTCCSTCLSYLDMQILSVELQSSGAPDG